MPHTWTPDAVEDAMVEAFRAALVSLPIVPVYSSGDYLVPAGKPDSKSRADAAASLDVLNWSARYVADKQVRRWVMIRISNKARRRDGVSEFCREAGVVRSTFDRSCERAFRAIADGLNRGTAAVAA